MDTTQPHGLSAGQGLKKAREGLTSCVAVNG
jgi:hypothetical protein